MKLDMFSMLLMNTEWIAIVMIGLATESANQEIITVFRVLGQRHLSQGYLASWILILFHCVASRRLT